MDDADPLRHCRERFTLPDGVIYLDGNSLGALPRSTPERIASVVEEEWGRGLIGSWNAHDWINAPLRLGARIARLIGARPSEVVVADSTSTNIFKLVAAGCLARPRRLTILSEPGNFPTDLYVAQGVAAMLPDHRLKLVPVETIADAIDADTAVVLLTHVHYRTGRKLDMAAITAAAHARGALIVWDLSHSTGAVTVDLGRCGADMAAGCGYKYLNGGPGAPAFLFVAERLHDELRSPLSGWMGHASPFAFGDGYEPAGDIRRWLCGTPPVIGMAALEEGLAQFDGIDMTTLVKKSQALCSMLVAGVETMCADHGFTLITPREPLDRGSHVSFAHDEAHAICQALIARGVIGDFRAPNVLRLGLAPLYTGFEDVRRAVEILADIMTTRAWDDPRHRVHAWVT